MEVSMLAIPQQYPVEVSVTDDGEIQISQTINGEEMAIYIAPENSDRLIAAITKAAVEARSGGRGVR